jgi:hypothetical protein
MAYNPSRQDKQNELEFFQGRDDILNAAARIMSTERAVLWEDMEISGWRGMGKTYVLLKIRSLAPQNSLTMYLPGSSTTEINFLGEFLMILEREQQAKHDRTTSFADLFASIRAGQKSGISAITEALSRIDDSSILILLDDAELIPIKALLVLKSAVYQARLSQNKRVLIVFASTESISEKLKKSGLSPAEAWTVPFRVNYFSFADTVSLLRRHYPQWSQGNFRIIFQNTNGYPPLIQMYGSAYHSLAESDDEFGPFHLLDDIEVSKSSKTVGGFVGLAKGLEWIKGSQYIISKCDAQVKKDLCQWYEHGWRQKPSKAEWKTAQLIAELGVTATFADIKKAYGRNPAPQLKRAVKKNIIEQRGRGSYALPHRLIAQAIKGKVYVFSWNKIPGKDNGTLIDFLKKKFYIDWVKTAKIGKFDIGKTIKVYTEKNSLSLKLNDKKTEVLLEIGDVRIRTNEFMAKMENDELNIYEKMYVFSLP